MAAEEAAAAALCPCACPFCCYRGPPAWRRAVKRKLDAEVESEDAAAAEELREKVRMQEETIQELWAELEQEQSAASTAASETMSMILRLQQEKAELAMEARQSKRFAEEQIQHLHAQILSLEDLLARPEDDDDDDDDCGGCDAQDPISESRIARLESDTVGDDDDATARALEEAMERTQRLEREKEAAEAEARRFRSFARDLEEELARRELAIETYRDLLRRHRIPLDDDDDDDGPVAIVDHGESDREEEDDDDDDDLRGSGELREPYPLVESPRSPQRSEKGAAEPIDAEELPSCTAEIPTPSDGDGKWDDDDDGDRVYTIDAVYGAPSVRVSGDGGSGAGERVEVKKLSARVEALEAEGEAMRRAMVGMGAEMARLALVREIAQRLCKEFAMERTSMVAKRRRSPVDTFSIIAIFKWICSLFCWRRKASRSRYTLGLSNYNVGLLLLLDKSPRMSQWRLLSRPQG
ncbi:myosin-binding protein 7-like [Ananas comosus]|uniref:Myosin-binding protein 7-like n=1 Tax=Ananas comosus TaxID=4615 RepID=A0A6P5FP82_ANACO|nr:myosin-binding protein 7-like [Ananas comosus]